MAKRSGPGGARPGSGPKPMPARLRRSHLVQVTLREGEWKQLERVALRQGVRASSLARELILAGLAKED